MDEPLSNLDAKLRVQTRGEIKRLQQEVGTTTVYVTHDQVEAMTMGDRIAVMNDGRLEQVGTPEELYERPANRFVGGLHRLPGDELREAAPRTAALRRRGLAAARLRAPRRRLVVGVRPEHARPWRDDGLVGPLEGRSSTSRRSGARRSSASTSAAARLVVCVEGRARAQPGDRVRFGIVGPRACGCSSARAARPCASARRRDDRRGGAGGRDRRAARACSSGSAPTARSRSWRARLARGAAGADAAGGARQLRQRRHLRRLRVRAAGGADRAARLDLDAGLRRRAPGRARGARVALSQSGETPDVVAWLEAMGRRGPRPSRSPTSRPRRSRAPRPRSCRSAPARSARSPRPRPTRPSWRCSRGWPRTRAAAGRALDDALGATIELAGRGDRVACRRRWSRWPRRSPGPSG